MGKIAICSDEPKQRALYLQGLELPANYMGDFSLMGFLVSNYSSAIQILAADGYHLEELEGGTEITFDSADQLKQIQERLVESGINCIFTDIVDTLYQA